MDRNAEIIARALETAKFVGIEAVAEDGKPFNLILKKPSKAVLAGIADAIRKGGV